MVVTEFQFLAVVWFTNRKNQQNDLRMKKLGSSAIAYPLIIPS